MSFYNVDAVIDNEYGALDNETLLSEIKKRASNPTQDIIDSLKDQAEAQRAQVEALGASKQAQEALKAAQAEQARIAAEAKAAAVAAATKALLENNPFIDPLTLQNLSNSFAGGNTYTYHVQAVGLDTLFKNI